MTRAITLTLLASLAFLASTAFAAPPRLEVRTLPPAGAAIEDVAAMEKLAAVLTEALSPDVVTAPAPDTLAANAVACAEDLSYQRCLQAGGTPWDPRSLTPPAGGADAVMLFVFDRSSRSGNHRGVFYLVPQSGKWVSAPFRTHVRDNRAEVRSPLAKLARAAGLDVPDGHAEWSFNASSLK